MAGADPSNEGAVPLRGALPEFREPDWEDFEGGSELARRHLAGDDDVRPA